MNRVSPDSSEKEIISAMKAYLKDPDHWIKGAGRRIHRRCVAYTILLVTGLEDKIGYDSQLLDKIAKALNFNSLQELIKFNDADTTTHSVLMNRLQDALQ